MKLFINANRTGYAPDQIRHTMTVAELIAALKDAAKAFKAQFAEMIGAAQDALDAVKIL
jgi:hypothetical protein